jgi:hypothetical protein
MPITVAHLRRNLAAMSPEKLREFVEFLVIYMYSDGHLDFGADAVDADLLYLDGEFPSGSDVCEAVSSFVDFEKILSTRAKKAKQVYTVVGIYADNNQQYADDFKARSLAEAVELAQAKVACAGNELIVAGVFLGGKLVV